MSAEEVADNLNNLKDRTVSAPISSAELLAWSGADSRFMRIKKAAEGVAPYDALPEAVQTIANVAFMLITRDSTELDMSKSDRVQMMGALVASGVLTQDDSDSISALATKIVSRAEELGLERIFPAHIQLIRDGEV
jgi:hypothetical protein